jgi:integrase
MPKKIEELSAIKIKRLIEPGKYAVGGVSGLMLRITNTGAKGWILRTTIGGKRVDAGLGGYPDVSLSDARENAREFKRKVKEGINPLNERKEAQYKIKQERASLITFEQAARDCWNVKKQEFKNPKHAAQWLSTLIQYVVPFIGDRPVAEVTTTECLEVLQPIWSEKPDTASRLRQRMSSIFDYAAAAGIRTQPNPAQWKGCLEPLLPAAAKVKKQKGQKHYPSLPYSEVGRLYADLTPRDNMSAFALRLLILTGTRSGEIRLAEWSEFDLDAGLWKIPAARMKAGKDHLIGLSPLMIELIRSVPRMHNCPFVFASPRGKSLSDATLGKLIKTMHEQCKNHMGGGYLDPQSERVATPHGMRSSFKEWARNQSGFADEVSELQLAHVSTDATRAAYARDSLLEQRRELMLLWESHCTS